MYYESPLHLFFTCRKLLVNNGVEMDLQIENAFKQVCGECFEADENEEYTVSLSSTFYNELKSEVLKKEFPMSISKTHNNAKKACEEYEKAKKENFIKAVIDLERTKESTRKTLEAIYQAPGVYYLYDKDKNLIYIGKSVNLASRVVTSMRERKAKFFKYSVIKNESNMNLYEVYLICKYKPLLNSACKSEDELTIELEEPKISEEYCEITYQWEE